jgi:hypothetical protein
MIDEFAETVSANLPKGVLWVAESGKFVRQDSKFKGRPFIFLLPWGTSLHACPASFSWRY